MSAGGEQPFIPDRRGNRLESYSFSVAPDGQSHRLYLRAAPGIAAQFQGVGPSGLRYRLSHDHVPGVGGWTHCLEGPGVPNARVRDLAELLSEALMLPKLRSVEFVMAMDWYKIPADDIDPRLWRNTLDGSLVHMGKYWISTPEAMTQAGRMLVRRMLAAIGRHPVLASVDAVVAVPGHDSAYLSLGERLAASVAGSLRVPLVKVATRRGFRPPAKELPGSGDNALRDEFSVTENLAGAIVLIVDDVFRTGGTMSAVGLAAVQAGAAQAYGLVGVRTLRS